MKSYDAIFSLGETCTTSIVLRELDLQKVSYPLDWSGAWNNEIAGSCGFLGKIAIINNYFNDCFNFQDLFETFRWGTDERHRMVRNSRTGLQYSHEFPWEKTVEEHYPEFKAKYERRVKRFYETIEKNSRILFVFIARWGGELSPHELIEGYNLLCKTFPGKMIDLLIFQRKDSLGVYETHRLILHPNITFIFYNDTATLVNADIGNLIVLKREIMRFLGIQYINFATDDICSTGFSAKEVVGYWSDGKSCLLSLKLDDIIKGPAELDFDLHPFVNEQHPILRVKVRALPEGEEEWIFEHGKPWSARFHLSEKIVKSGQCDLVFQFDSPSSPLECGMSGDARKLGLFFKSIKISTTK